MEQLTLANVSKYLSKDVIDQVFKIKTKSDDDVKRVEVSRAAPAGEGMLSAVYRIKVTGTNHTESFVAKGLVQDMLLRRSVDSTGFFKREALFFSKILPVLIEVQKSLGAKENVQDCLPVCYGCYIDGKQDYIIMEDFSARNLKSLPKQPVKHHRDIVLKVLAHFHSVSLALRIKKPDVFEKITQGLYELYYNDENREWYAKYLQNAIDIDKNVMAEIDGTNGEYYKKFEEFLKGDVYEQLVVLSAKRGDHPIINHGDAWYPNFLWGKDDAVVLDFQILRCASPATDLSYFLILCSNLSASREDFIEGLKVYYDALEYYLKDMGIEANNVFSFDTLKEEIKRYGRFGLLAALTSIPLMASERYDVLQALDVSPDCKKIPLEELWRLSPITAKEDKMRLVNAVRIAVDMELI